MEVSVAQVHNRLSHWLDRIPEGPITITRHGKPVGILISPEEYESLRQMQAYVKMVRVSRSLRESGVTAAELYETSRDELEDRP